MHGGHLRAMKPFLALFLLSLSGIGAVEQYVGESNYVDPLYQPQQHFEQPALPVVNEAEYAVYPEESNVVSDRTDLIDRQLEAFVAGPVATVVAMALAGVIGGGFAISSADDGRKALQSELDTVNKEIAALETSFAANTKKMDSLCSAILNVAFLDLVPMETAIGALPTAKNKEKAFKAALDAILVQLRLQKIANKDNRCLSSNSNTG